MEWIVQLPILFFSIMVHEVSHGVVALRNGDDTAKRAGRLTFNPLPHVDPLGSILLPVVCRLSGLPMIGWAKPVPIDPKRLREGRWSLMRVALAGPCSNLALSLAAALLFRALGFLSGATRDALMFAVSINLFLAYFNLLPIHPLDGSKVLGMILPARLRRRYERHRPYGFAIIILLISLGWLHGLVLRPSLATLELYQRMGLIW